MGIDAVTICYDDGVTGSEVCQSSQSLILPSSLSGDLVSWYALETSSDPQPDETGANNLTKGGDPTTGTGKKSNGQVFDGVGDEYYISSASAGDFKPGDSSFTAAIWAYPTTASFNDGAMGCYSTLSGGLGWGIRIDGSDTTAWQFARGENSGTSEPDISAGAGSLNLNAWHLIIVWRDADAQECGIQVNNNTPVTSAQVLGLGTPAYKFSIGSVLNNRFVGTLDEAAFWNRPLTSDERDILWNNGNGITYSQFS